MVLAGSVKWMTRLMKAVSKAAAGRPVLWQSAVWNLTLSA
jgi:hypothetical protein